MMKSLFDKTIHYAKETALIQSTLALLEWDQHAFVPSRSGIRALQFPTLAADYRSEQVAWLSSLAHKRATANEYGDWLRALAESELASLPHSAIGGTIRGLLRDYLIDVQLPEELVRATAKATSIGQQVWAEAKVANDFSLFQPALEEIVRLRREEASLLQKPGKTKYDSLLDQYEEGADSVEIAKVFTKLREDLVPIVLANIEKEKRSPKKLAFGNVFDVDAQRKLSHWVAEVIGYEFTRGRLDETEHPFCTTLGPHDHRILTRYFEDSYSSGLYGVLHEAGHGMYEQGLPVDWFGLPAGSAASLGVHESQSRLWENIVGRSHGFWKWLLPHAKSYLPALASLSIESILADLNRVEASLIRIESDEATYNLHIFIRFEIEKELIDGDLPVSELPEVWKSKYQEYLGVCSEQDGQGVLQDVHWSAGLIGYFPTYTLGNLYAAQLAAAAEIEIGNLNEMFSQGEFATLLKWLRTNIHQHGRSIPPSILMENAVGRPLTASDFLNYLNAKLEFCSQL